MSKMKNKTTLRLGLYGPTARKTIEMLFMGLRERVQLSNPTTGVLEEAQGRAYTGTVTKVRADATGEVLLDVDTDMVTGPWSKYYESRRKFSAYHGASPYSVFQVKAWLAKELVRRLGGAKDDDIVRLHPASKTAQTSRGWEVRATAAALAALEGKDVEAEFGKAKADRVVGRMADPVAVEIAEVVAEEAAKIRKAFDMKRKERHDAMCEAIEAVRARYRAELRALGKEERRAVSEMKKETLAV